MPCDNKLIEIDASSWKRSSDIYDALLPCLGAPDWHGTNVNALTESIVWGNINSVEPPYTLRIRGTTNLPPEVAEELSWLSDDVKKMRDAFKVMKGRDIDVAVELLP